MLMSIEQKNQRLTEEFEATEASLNKFRMGSKFISPEKQSRLNLEKEIADKMKEIQKKDH